MQFQIGMTNISFPIQTQGRQSGGKLAIKEKNFAPQIADVNPKLDTRISVLRLSFVLRPLSVLCCTSSVTLTVLPLKSETGWTEELCLKTNLLN